MGVKYNLLLRWVQIDSLFTAFCFDFGNFKPKIKPVRLVRAFYTRPSAWDQTSQRRRWTYMTAQIARPALIICSHSLKHNFAFLICLQANAWIFWSIKLGTFVVRVLYIGWLELSDATFNQPVKAGSSQMALINQWKGSVENVITGNNWCRHANHLCAKPRILSMWSDNR
jgi:hypothetical protein